MVLGMIWSVGLIMLVQSPGFLVEGENGAKCVDDLCSYLEKSTSQCNRRLHRSSGPSAVKDKCTLYANNKNNVTFYHNFNDTGKEFRVSLYRGINKSSSVCEGSFNGTQLPFDCNNCRVIPSASHVTFHLQSLNEHDTDIYYFCMSVMYPPPYICECDEGTIIHVIEPKKDKLVIQEIQKSPLTLLIILGCIAAYSVIITTAFAYLLTNRRRTRIQQSEYINVVPRRPKNHKPHIPYATNPNHPCLH